VAAGEELAAAEATVLPAVAAAMSEYLRLAAARVLGPGYRTPAYLVAAAAAQPPPPDMDAWPPADAYEAAFVRHVHPHLGSIWGQAFANAARTADISDHHARLGYLAQVSDRLSADLWPQGTFDEARYELLEGMDQGESVTQLRDRVGSVTHIDAYSRQARADINHWRKVRDDPAVSPAERTAARGRLRELYARLDEADTQWHYQARRVARTEVMASVNGGSFAGAQARAAVTGEVLWKAWLAADDHRTRDSHAAADGQLQPIAQPFAVGGAALQHPGEAGGPAAEVVNCRCTLIYMSTAEARAAGYHVGSTP
jgi:F like protein